MLIVRDFRHPLLGTGDVNQWLHQSYFFAEHLEFLPLPHLNFLTDDALYPYGVNNVFRPWNFESAYFYSAAYRLFGHGPWLQWYYLISVLLCAALAYAIIGHEWGTTWGLLGALALSFGNFHAISRFPGHYGLAMVHWTTASILLDFVLVRRVVQGRPISLQLLLAKLTILVLAFGHDLGYVCGIALTSSAVTAVWIAVLLLKRLGYSSRAWRGACTDALRTLKRGASQHRLATAFLALSMAVSSVLYLPLVGDVFLAARSVDTGGFHDIGLTTNPCRMLVPIVPGIDHERLLHWFHFDFAEEVFDCRPGAALVVGSLVALAYAWFDKRTRWMVFPFAVLVVLFACFISRWSPLSILPWCAHARANNRFSVALPVLFFGIILSVPWRHLARRRLGVLVWALLGLWVVEVGSAYSYLGQRSSFRFLPDETFYEFNRVISRAPGEAVLEWPFMVVGGNGVGMDLGPFYRFQAGIEGLKAFHHKKTMSGYLGRLYPPQIAPLLTAGWQFLSLPNDPDRLRVTRQRRGLNSAEWSFLEEFFRRNDFCGVIVYVDLLPEETRREFRQRFGMPIAEATLPEAGRVEFIPKPKPWLKDVDRKLGLSLKLPLSCRYPVMEIEGTRATPDVHAPSDVR